MKQTGLTIKPYTMYIHVHKLYAHPRFHLVLSSPHFGTRIWAIKHLHSSMPTHKTIKACVNGSHMKYLKDLGVVLSPLGVEYPLVSSLKHPARHKILPAGKLVVTVYNRAASYARWGG